MTSHAVATDLMRAIGLVVDGPVRWGAPSASRAPGIFVVELPDPLDRAPIDQALVRQWLESVPGLRVDGQPCTPAVLTDRLASFWQPGQSMLYVGHTSRSLGPRVAAMYATPLGRRRPHAGGHWLRTLAGLPRARLWWAETDSPEEHADALLGAFAEIVSDGATLAPPLPVLPWANLETITGERRQTGISGSLLVEPEAPPAIARKGSRPSPTSSRASRPPVRSSGGARRSGATATRAAHGKPAETHVTAAGLDALQAELRELVEVGRPEVVLRVKNARELGDLRENADYEAARNEHSFLEGRVRDIEQRIRTAVIIEATDSGAVGLGSRVLVEHDGETTELTIVGSTESDPAAGRISQASPVGKALLGHHAGDEVAVKLPARELVYRVIEVR